MNHHVRTAAQALRYLARVGAYRYVDAPRAALCAWSRAAHVPAVPEDHGLVSRPDKYQGGTPRPLRNLGAFDVYAEAEKTALDAIGKVDDDVDLEPIVEALKLGLEEGERVRAGLIRKGQQIPGRGEWLVPQEWAAAGAVGMVEGLACLSGTPVAPQGSRS